MSICHMFMYIYVQGRTTPYTGVEAVPHKYFGGMFNFIFSEICAF